MPKMIEGKIAEKGKYSFTQKCRNQNTVLLQNTENLFSQFVGVMLITKPKININSYKRAIISFKNKK